MWSPRRRYRRPAEEEGWGERLRVGVYVQCQNSVKRDRYPVQGGDDDADDCGFRARRLSHTASIPDTR